MAEELMLKYGCNPNQKPARIFMAQGELPVTVLSGRPGYINFLDALNAYQLVRELKEATGVTAAASFKHVSPAGAALGLPLSDTLRKMYFVDDETLSPQAAAYVRARGCDRVSSYGDFIAFSDECDLSAARQIYREVSDGVIAPAYSAEALELLKKKRGGNYNVIQIDPGYVPDAIEHKQVYGVTFEQGRNDVKINKAMLAEIVTAKTELPLEAETDMLVALIALKYTQSNSVCYAEGGQTIGVGAGQQSRILCTRLAGSKADNFHLRQHPKTLALKFNPKLSRSERDNTIDLYLSEAESADVLGENVWSNFFTAKPEPLTDSEKKEWLAKFTGVSLGSDAFFPFGDNIRRARRSGVTYVAQPGGSVRDDDVIAACNELGMVMAFTHQRLFHH